MFDERVEAGDGQFNRKARCHSRPESSLGVGTRKTAWVACCKSFGVQLWKLGTGSCC
jgi:hypothetical protein